MRVRLIDLKDPRDLVVDKTIAGGMGTATRYGKGLFGGFLTRVKSHLIRLLPYNVAYLAALLRGQGHEVAYQSEARPADFDVGILFSAIPSKEVDTEALRFFRSRNIPTIVVGTLATVAPELYSEATLVLKGEAEAFFLNPSWTVELSADIPPMAKVMDVGRVEQLDELPFPDWSIFPVLSSRYAIVSLSRPVLPVVTSRGCAYPCSYYCPYPLGEGTRMRYRSPASVVRELELNKDRFGVSHFKFRDPILTINRRRSIELLDALDQSGLRVIWGCETHLAQLDEELLTRMAGSGCRLIQTGVETTNPSALRASHRKSAEIAHQEKMLELAQRLGIRVAIYFIVGLPEDNLEAMRQSLDYAATLPAAYIQITACTPYPGTKFFDDVRHRLTTRDWHDLDQYTPVLHSDNFSHADLLSMMSHGYRKFYLRKDWVRGSMASFYKGLQVNSRVIRHVNEAL